jgi:hypothetical protein
LYLRGECQSVFSWSIVHVSLVISNISESGEILLASAAGESYLMVLPVLKRIH